MVLVSYDPDAAATYVELSKTPISRTVEITDEVMVDVDEAGTPVGLEFLVMPDKITAAMLAALQAHFPDLEMLRNPRRWLPVAS